MTQASDRTLRCRARMDLALDHPKGGTIIVVYLVDEPRGVQGGPMYRPLSELEHAPREGDAFDLNGVQGKVLGVDDGNRGRGARVLGCLGAEPLPPMVGVWVDVSVRNSQSGSDINFFVARIEGTGDV